MNTPISDFIENYAEKNTARFHMPGHKGKAFVGVEKYDITEIDGADVLSTADGIIAESENNASELFGTAHSFYVTQGSTTAICAMLALVKKSEPEKTVVLAARNVHKAFIHACALLDIEPEWIAGKKLTSVIKCDITSDDVEKKLLNCKTKPSAVYLTSPDYLGNLQDIKEISKICRKYNVPLLVDNAHGAYFKFLEKSLHPIDLGADMCCDSAHKTLPVLTGGAYLHISETAPKSFLKYAREKLAIFSSTSPSYLILKSLDMCNAYLSGEYKKELADCIKKTEKVKKEIIEKGFRLEESEPLKIVVGGGDALAKRLKEFNIEIEFYDRDFLVLMVTPHNSDKDFELLKEAFSIIEPLEIERKESPKLSLPEKMVSIREAVFSENELVDIECAEGRICASLTVSCPPAVPLAVCGEKINKELIELFKYYGVEKIKVVR